MTGDLAWKIDTDNDRLDWFVDPTTNSIATTGSLESAVIISLFTDKRAPDTWTRTDDKRGWWGNDDSSVYEMGSLLWTLWYIPTQTTDDYTNLVSGICKDALQWLIEEKIAEDIDITVSMITSSDCRITITVTQPNQTEQYKYMWSPSPISEQQSGSIGGPQ
ncbi:phage GP46 family protein [Gluconobacter sp. DsW_056]|uniref:phage GP46 family protein n=1 Tax=Gluconobacter sp. DsW_056 TaxID=1511209 RepID=UPI000A3B620E|nr:phage GP46 family protein [Gluconobacter sp. DsW_056]